MALTQLSTLKDERSDLVRIGENTDKHLQSISTMEKLLEDHYHDLMDIFMQSGVNVSIVSNYELYNWVAEELGFAFYWRGFSHGSDVTQRKEEFMGTLQMLDNDADLQECYTIYKGIKDLQPLKEFLIEYNVMSPEEIKSYEKHYVQRKSTN